MVQTFGKRIIGGIGAPGGGMSKAYAEGVNTGINQRMNRQSMSAVEQEMRMREQDQQFKIEDREEAKRRRAAAAAAAASAKARNIATTRAIAAAGGAGGAGSYWPGTRGAGLNVQGAPTARGTSAYPLSTGTPVPRTEAPPAGAPAPRTSAAATPATDRRTAGLSTYDNMNISNIVDVQGTYGNQSTIPQRRAAAAANVRAGVQTGLPPEAMTAPVLSNMAARPGNFAAQAAQRAMAAAAPATPGARLSPGATALVTRQTAGARGSLSIPALQQYRQEITDRIKAEVEAKAAGGYRLPFMTEDLPALIAEQQRIDAEIEAAQMQPSRVGLQTRGMTAEEGPGSTAVGVADRIAAQEAFVGPPVAPPVTIQGPNGPITVPAESLDYANVVTPPIMPPGAFPAGRMDIPVPPSPELGFGGAGSPQTDLAGGTTYGGRLGAAPTPTEMFFSDMGYTPAGQLDIQAIMAEQRGPMKDPEFSKIAEQQRVMYMYAAEDAIANGDAAAFIAAQKGIKEQEMLILAQQVVAGADEAINFGSTERLNMAASMIEGVDIVFLPNGDGTVDVYVNEQLDDENIPIESIIDKLRMDVDAAYVEQMATAAAEERKAQLEIYTANEKDRFETMMNMQESEFGAVLARETAREGEFDKITAKVIEQKLIDSGQLPSTSKNTVVKTDNGIVVISEDGGIQREYLFSPEDGRLTEILE